MVKSVIQKFFANYMSQKKREADTPLCKTNAGTQPKKGVTALNLTLQLLL